MFGSVPKLFYRSLLSTRKGGIEAAQSKSRGFQRVVFYMFINYAIYTALFICGLKMRRPNQLMQIDAALETPSSKPQS